MRLGNFVFFARGVDQDAVDVVATRDEYAIVDHLLGQKDGPTVVDLGANIGMFSLRIFTACPSATVHAVEPSSATYQVLMRNRQANSNLDWHLYQAAIWQHDGLVKFHNSEMRSSASAVREDGDETVPAMRLTTLFSEHLKTKVDLLKIDVEGSEEKAICENQETLSGVEEIIIQIHPEHCSESRVAAALNKSFDFLYKIPGCVSSNPLLLASRRQHDLPRYSTPIPTR